MGQGTDDDLILVGFTNVEPCARSLVFHQPPLLQLSAPSLSIYLCVSVSVLSDLLHAR